MWRKSLPFPYRPKQNVTESRSVHRHYYFERCNATDVRHAVAVVQHAIKRWDGTDAAVRRESSRARARSAWRRGRDATTATRGGCKCHNRCFFFFNIALHPVESWLAAPIRSLKQSHLTRVFNQNKISISENGAYVRNLLLSHLHLCTSTVQTTAA